MKNKRRRVSRNVRTMKNKLPVHEFDFPVRTPEVEEGDHIRIQKLPPIKGDKPYLRRYAILRFIQKAGELMDVESKMVKANKGQPISVDVEALTTTYGAWGEASDTENVLIDEETGEGWALRAVRQDIATNFPTAFGGKVGARGSSIVWDASARKLTVDLVEGDAHVRGVLDVDVTTVIRIRKVGEKWGPGIETPLSSLTFTNMEPGETYEIERWHRTPQGDGKKSISRHTVSGKKTP